jgi:hypothetical protein
MFQRFRVVGPSRSKAVCLGRIAPVREQLRQLFLRGAPAEVRFERGYDVES